MTFAPTLSVTTFTAPSEPGALSFTLAVTDSLGLPDPTPDEVLVTISNQAPVADAGPDQSVDMDTTVILDGSGSSDLDGDLPLAYHWTQSGGPAVTFTPNLSVTTFTAPSDPEVLTFTLVVTDSLGLPDPTPDEVVVTVLPGQVLPPVNSLNDPGDGTCDASECTLREAVTVATNGDTITFEPALARGTIILGSQITLDKDLTIDGSGLSPHVQINGGGSVRVFRVTENVTVAIGHLDIRNGDADIGGGIDVFSSTLMVSNTTFAGNSADDGGAINNNNATLHVIDSSFVDNNTAPTGGGIFNNTGHVTATNSTWYGNNGTSVAGGLQLWRSGR